MRNSAFAEWYLALAIKGKRVAGLTPREYAQRPAGGAHCLLWARKVAGRIVSRNARGLSSLATSAITTAARLRLDGGGSLCLTNAAQRSAIAARVSVGIGGLMPP